MLFESQDAITKRILNIIYKLLKLKEDENVTKPIHTFKSMSEQLLTTMAPIFKEDHVIPSLMKSMPLNL
jgi:hypothetical protein